MSEVRILVGTRKGAFVLSADAKRDPERFAVSGPHFAGWEVFHVKGSPADPDRLYASQSSSWFGQVIQRSDDGGKSWNPVGDGFAYDGVPGTHAQLSLRRVVLRVALDRSRSGGNEWEALTRGLPQRDCYVNVFRDAMAVDALDPCGVYFGTTGGQVYASPDGGDRWAPIVRDLPPVLSVEVQTLP